MDLFSDESDNELFEAGIFDSKSYTGSNKEKRYMRVNYCEILADSDFTFRFRLNKTTVDQLLTKILPSLRVTSSRNHGVSPLHQVLLTLRFYALGTMLLSVADFVGVSKATASRIVADVSRAIAGLYAEYVQVLEDTQHGFYAIAGFPNVLGAIGCTHVPIQSPDANKEEEYRNRIGIFSLNVQGVCNADLIFMNVIARWPGSAHNSTIFNNSFLKMQCEDKCFGDRWLIGDNAYACTSYLLTPLVNPISVAEHRYNEAHTKTRNTIERCFSAWKRRFPVLTLKIRLRLQTTQALIIATSVLHNICRINDLAEVEPEVEIPPEQADILPFNEVAYQHHVVRHQLINTHFDR